MVAMSFVARTALVYTVDASYLGLNAIALNFIALISIAEAGIATALTFRLYAPLGRGDSPEVAVWLSSARSFYRLAMGLIILLGSLSTLALALGSGHLGFGVWYVVAVGGIATAHASASCAFATEKVLLLADQRARVVIGAKCVSFLLQTVVQVVALVVFGNFLLFLLSAAAGMLLWNFLCAVYVQRHYAIEREPFRAPAEDGLLRQDIWHLLPYKMGAVGLNATDALIVAIVLSSSLAGIVSNFTLVVNSVNGVLMQGFNGIAASIGLHNNDSSPEGRSLVFYQLSSLGMWVFGSCALCLTLLLNPLIELWIGSSYLVDQATVFALAGAFFVTGANQVPALYRSSLGIFRQTRFVPLAATAINLFLSVALGMWLGVVGVFVATIIARGLTFSIVDPLLVTRKALSTSFRAYVLHYVHAAVGLGVMGIVANRLWGVLYSPGVIPFVAGSAVTVIAIFLGMGAWFYLAPSFRQVVTRVRLRSG